MDIQTAAGAVAEVLEQCSNGGNLHIVIEDGNVHDDHLAFCYAEIDEAYDAAVAQLVCCQLLKRLTQDQRIEAIRLGKEHLRKSNEFKARGYPL